MTVNVTTIVSQGNQAAFDIERHVLSLIETVHSLGLELTIERRPETPLAMGNRRYVVEVFPSRQCAPLPAQWVRDNQSVYCALMLCGGHDVPESAVAAWTDEQCRQAQDWALTEHVAASDNDDVVRLPMPEHVKAWPPQPKALTGTVDDLWL